MVFIFGFLGAFIVLALALSMCGLDFITSISGAATAVTNVGPGLGEVGSMDNFSAMPAAFKVSNSLLMLLGRLEIFGLIQIFFIKWWR